ncbi:S8 family serine peptidase [candidate division KSB1 bacterium]|nr:S8 family serine peptidase [candidate division KSB1 bacterium]
MRQPSTTRRSTQFLLHLIGWTILTGSLLYGNQNPPNPPAEILIRVHDASSLRLLQGDLDHRIKTVQPRLQSALQINLLPIFTSQNPEARRIQTPSFDPACFVKLKVADSLIFRQIIDFLNNSPLVVYAQPNYLRCVNETPNDPEYSKQWAIPLCEIDRAWEMSHGSKDIILAVIDTGIDYWHEDLRANIWLNSGEDVNRNGVVDSSDFNGIDDDENGFIDDIRGWDFTDAPAWADGGDYLERDNDPQDEHGHGTAIAGIIAACANNGIGISGAAPDCKVMNLRAGTLRGLLEEDDVASAIVYAVENGARVINMSFGDQVASPFLRDVISFGYHCNCVLVAAAGNSGSFAAHYPSGFAETISVGATTAEDILAGFSNYGSTVDLVAPGVDIRSTAMNNTYASFSGTSASAPFVTAVCGLLLSVQPQLDPDLVKACLIASADDSGDPGWDVFYAAGRLNARKALSLEEHPIASITLPRMDQGLGGDRVQIVGTAAGPLLDYYELAYGVGDKPENYTLFHSMKHSQIIEDTLGVWDISALEDTLYTLRLSVVSKNFTTVEDKIICSIDHTAPLISNVNITGMIDGNAHSALIEFITDDICEASLYFRSQNSADAFCVFRIPYETSEHRFNFTQNLASGNLEFYIEATNRAGLVSTNDHNGHFFSIDFSQPPIGTSDFVGIESRLPSGYLLDKPADFDDDGLPEFLITRYSAQFQFEQLELYEYQQGEFIKVSALDEVLIPRDWGDSDGDGLREILIGAGRTSFILESAAPGTIPNQIIWADSNDCWASRFADTDGDGKFEIIARVGESFLIFESSGDNQYALIDSLPNPTEGENGAGVPHAEVADFDGDGRNEILLGDYDGDIYIYKSIANNSYQFLWSDRLPLIDAIDFLTAGDYDGDGSIEFAAGCHSDPSLDHEHEYDSRHWLIRIYKYHSGSGFNPVWEQCFFGFFPPADYDCGLSSGDVDGDGRDELLLALFPNCHLVEFQPPDQAYQVIWYTSPCRSNRVAISDIDADGQNEVLLNDGSEIVGFKALSPSGAPATPLGLKAQMLDTNRVQLTWAAIENCSYRIYRGNRPDSLYRIDETLLAQFDDTTLRKGNDYYYAVTAVDASREPSESRRSALLHIHPSEKPTVVAGEFFPPRQILLSFSEVMDASVKNVFHYLVEPDYGFPASVVTHKNGSEVILTLRNQPRDRSTLAIEVNDVFDRDGMPIDTVCNRVTIDITQPPGFPYLVRAELAEKHRVRLVFNEALDESSALNPDNYTFEPDIKINQVETDATHDNIFNLDVDPRNPIGAYGKNYIIRVKNVMNLSGQKIQSGKGDAVSLVFYQQDLSRVSVFPNPCIISGNESRITFINLTPTAKIRILTLSGRIVQTIEETDGNGGVSWDLRNKYGEQISSGIYLYYVEGNGDSMMGKFAVVR